MVDGESSQLPSRVTDLHTFLPSSVDVFALPETHLDENIPVCLLSFPEWSVKHRLRHGGAAAAKFV